MYPTKGNRTWKEGTHSGFSRNEIVLYLATMAEEYDRDDFSAEAAQPQPGILREFFDFLLHNKKWWLTPIIVVLLLFGLLISLGSSAAAPFIYTLF